MNAYLCNRSDRLLWQFIVIDVNARGGALFYDASSLPRRDKWSRRQTRNQRKCTQTILSTSILQHNKSLTAIQPNGLLIAPRCDRFLLVFFPKTGKAHVNVEYFSIQHHFQFRSERLESPVPPPPCSIYLHSLVNRL